MGDGLPLLGGAQLARLFFPLTREGEAKPRAETVSGACLTVVRRREEVQYPEMVGDHGRTRLVVLAWPVLVGNSPFPEVPVKVQGVPQILQGRAHAAWIKRWSSMLACSAARAFALSLCLRTARLARTDFYYWCTRC